MNRFAPKADSGALVKLAPRPKTRLRVISIDEPCEVPWESMSARDELDAIRHCALCKKNVYNIASMSPEEAESIFHQGDACVQLYARADGTVVQQNCKREEKKKSLLTAAKGALLGSSLTALVMSSATLLGAEEVLKQKPKQLVDPNLVEGLGLRVDPAPPTFEPPIHLPVNEPVYAPPVAEPPIVEAEPEPLRRVRGRMRIDHRRR